MTSSATDPTTAEANTALVRRYIDEAWNQGRVDVLDELCGPGFESGHGGTEGMKAAIRWHRTSFPDLRLTIEETIADGTRVAYRWVARGTHQGDYEGLAPTGRTIAVTGITIVETADGRIVRDVGETSIAGLTEQLRP